MMLRILSAVVWLVGHGILVSAQCLDAQVGCPLSGPIPVGKLSHYLLFCNLT